jgi:hypothetical protein
MHRRWQRQSDNKAIEASGKDMMKFFGKKKTLTGLARTCG